MDRQTNLLKETVEALGYAEKTGADVLWVGSRDGDLSISWDAFEGMAAHIEYDCSWGTEEIANDLVVVGDGWWLERWEYDGSEGWRLCEPPQREKDSAPFMVCCSRQTTDRYETRLKEMQAYIK